MGKLKNYNHQLGNTHNLQYSHEKFLELHKQGLNDTEISRILGCSHATIAQKRRKFKLKSNFIYKSKIDIKILKELYDLNKNDKEIGEYFNVNNRWISEKRNQLNLKPKFKYNVNISLGELTYEEEQVLIGTVLGDGSLSKWSKDSKVGGTRCSITHGFLQKNYLFWKYEKLKRFCNSKPKYSKRYHKIKKKFYENYSFQLRSDTSLNKYRDLFYKNNIKTITLQLLEKIDPLALAVWFMDDGARGTMGGYYLCTNCFSEIELNLIIDYFKSKWNLDCTIHNNKDNRRVLYINKKSGIVFKSLIEEYIHPDLKYKLH